LSVQTIEKLATLDSPGEIIVARIRLEVMMTAVTEDTRATFKNILEVDV
jgi:hypothetical protein